ncbi:VIT and vWA domain-containing protein [Photobacterium galatheae]|uniref:VIT and vWA domain-containing protein n=1 Tax=Photobacterium galatheae TaxID=1654360 RepID=UPI0009DFE9E5|nr:VIT and VWA domain-containing protein [Photobacterium galatheae]MCM0146980.1 VWA domain-containing protein [Photobacterium galatheae]
MSVYCCGFVCPAALASGLLKPVKSQYQDLQIQSHHVNVVIEDGYATTSIEQEFFNPNETELEALYAFPVPQKAVVGEFIYWINGQPVIAEAVAKDKARVIYNEQKDQGNATALTEKNSYKTFEMRVFPVQPQQRVKVKLVYVQDALLDHGVGRYVYPMEEGGVDEQAESFWTRNDRVEETFSFNVTVKSAYPVDGLRLPAHPQARISQSQQGEQTIWHSEMTNQQFQQQQTTETNDTQTVSRPFRLDQDIVVYWRLKDGLPGRLDMIAYRDPQRSPRGTVKLTFTPGDDLEAITQGRDWTFVLDKSGSMTGDYSTLVDGVERGLSKLPTNDRFRIIMFDDSAHLATKGFLPVTAENIQTAFASVNRYQPDGGTNLYEGIELAVSNLDADRPSGIVLVTDGVANVGTTAKREFLKLMQQYDVRLYTFIMGNSANTPLLEPMTKVSNGFAISVSTADDMLGHLMNVSSKLTHQAYRDVQLEIDGVKIKDLTPKQINSLYRGEQLTVFGHYFQPGKTSITLSATVNGQEREYKTEINLPESTLMNPEIERLWAFSAIRDLEEQMNYLEQKDSDKEQAIESLAVEYGLLTDYTSLLVVEDAVFEQLGIKRQNKQRVEKEQQARQQRENSTAASTRVDHTQPMFHQSAPSYSRGSGGGSLNGFALFALFILTIWRIRQPQN